MLNSVIYIHKAKIISCSLVTRSAPEEEGQISSAAVPFECAHPPHTTTDKCVVPSKDSLANQVLRKLVGLPPNPGTLSFWKEFQLATGFSSACYLNISHFLS